MNELDVSMEKVISPVLDQLVPENNTKNPDLITVKDNLTNNFNAIEKKLNEHFENLKSAVEKRKTLLIDELKKSLVDQQAFLTDTLLVENNEKENNIISESQNAEIKKLTTFIENEKLEFITDKYFSKDNPSDQDLSSVIQGYGRLLKVKSPEYIEASKIFNSEQIECKLDGVGLRQCQVNVKSKFTISFKNQNGVLSKSNVSFLDIFIITSGETTSAAKSNFQTSRLTLNDKNQIGTKKRLSLNNNSTVTRTPDAKRCKCDCTLECVAEGVYAVHYKLDKKGIYLLNILVNKVHVGESPYKLKCTEVPRAPTADSNSRIKRPIKTQSSYNINKSANSSIPHSATNGDIKKSQATNGPKSKSVSRTNSMSHLSNISNKKSKLPNSNTTNFNFSNCSTPTHSSELKKISNSTTNKTDDDVLINRLPASDGSTLTKSVSSNFQNDLSSSRGFKEDDFLFHIGSRGRNAAEFLNPQAVCATNDFIYISDSNNQKVDVFGHNGDFKFTLGGNLQSTNKIIRRPIGIDSTLDKKILVVDYEFKCVNVFEENGKFISRICQGKLLGPKGICVNKYDKNQIVVADSKSNCVCIFDSEGKFLVRFGNLGNKNENFAGPQYVSCLNNGDIAITDFYNHCIKVFDCQGQFRFSFGSNGLNQGQFNGPTGITTDREDNIIVVDWGNSRIQVFDKHGGFIKYINSELNQLYGPQDIALINNTIAVADSGNHCVKIFEYS